MSDTTSKYDEVTVVFPDDDEAAKTNEQSEVHGEQQTLDDEQLKTAADQPAVDSEQAVEEQAVPADGPTDAPEKEISDKKKAARRREKLAPPKGSPINVPGGSLYSDRSNLSDLIKRAEQLDQMDPSERAKHLEQISLGPTNSKGAEDTESLEEESLPDIYKNVRYDEEKEHHRSWSRVLVEILTPALITVAVALLVRLFILDVYIVPTDSMAPTIEVGDRLLGEKISAHMHSYERGDVVFFDDPEVQGRILVKRVVAVGGQLVTLRDGKLLIDGEGTFEPYTHGKETWPADINQYTIGVDYPFTVPEGYIWVLGDNRDHSLDSRYFGSVPDNAILAKAVFRIWPLDQFGFVE